MYKCGISASNPQGNRHRNLALVPEADTNRISLLFTVAKRTHPVSTAVDTDDQGDGTDWHMDGNIYLETAGRASNSGRRHRRRRIALELPNGEIATPRAGLETWILFV